MADPECIVAGRASSDLESPPIARLVQTLILAGYLAGAVAVTWHLWADPASRAAAGNPHDADLFAWYLRYVGASVAHGHLPALITSRLNAPQGISLMWNTSMLLPGVVLAPVTWLAGPQVSLTILTTAGFFGSAAAMMLVLRRWRVTLGSAALAGAIYGFSPALVQSAIGHYNLQFAVLPPLIVNAGLRLFFRPGEQGQTVLCSPRQSIRAGAWLGLLAAAQYFIAEEMLALSALAGITLILCLAVIRPAASFYQLKNPRWLAGLAVATVVTLVLIGVALVTQFAGPLTQHGSPFLVDYFKNDLTVFVDPSRYVLWHTTSSAAAAAGLPGGAPEQLGYLGWPMIGVLAVSGLAIGRLDRRILALALAFLVLGALSLGAHPEVAGVTNSRLTLPWHWLEATPVLGYALPDRLSILTDGVAAVMLALMLDRLGAVWRSARRRGAAVTRAAVVLAVVLAVVQLIPAPLPVADVPALPAGWAAALSSLSLASGTRLLVVPVPEPTLTVGMRWQATTGADISLVGGYFIGPASNGSAYVGGDGPRPTANYLDALWLTTPEGRLAGLEGSVPASPSARPARSVVQADLAYWQPAAVLADTTARSALGRYLVAILGPPSVARGSVMAWRLPRMSS